MQKINKKIAVSIAILFVLSLLTEIFICNFRYFQSLGYSEITEYTLQYDDGIRVNADGTITVLDEGERRIELLNINQEVHNIFLDFNGTYMSGDKEQELKATTVQIFMTDRGNAIYYGLPQRKVVKGVTESHYIKLNLSGKSEKLAIDLSPHAGTTFQVPSIRLNVTRPFVFSGIRLLIIFSLLLMIYGCVKMKECSKILFDIKSGWQNGVTAALFLIMLGCWMFFANSNPCFTEDWNTHHYYKLTEALASGQVNIQIEPSPELLAMENPYDYSAREKNGVEYEWDYAFYNGKYYVYFGVVPVILVYLPYYLIRGYHIMDHQVIMLGIVLLSVSYLLLLRKIVDKYFKKTSFVLFLMLYFLSVNAIGCALLAHKPDLYYIPIVFGLQFTVWGLYAWLCGREKQGWKRYVTLGLGALAMALVAGCRPQLVLGSFFILPILVMDWWEKLKKKDWSFWKDIAVIAIPYVLVAAGLMYYNALRFDSPFDFGANYNLTTNDMTVRGFRLDRIATGIFAYLLQLPRLRCSFPYLEDTIIETAYQGITIKEAMYGGAFMTNLLLFAGVAVLFHKGFYSNKKMLFAQALSVIFALVIVVMDTQMAGILFRYTLDFMVFLYLPAIAAICSIDNKLKENVCYVWLLRGVWLCFMWGMLYYSMFYVLQDDISMESINPVLYYTIANKVQFWL